MIKARSAQNFLDPIQKRASARSVQLEAMYLEDLLYESIHVVQGLFVWFPLRFICVSKKQSLSQQPRHLVIFLADKTVSEGSFKSGHLSLISSFTPHNVFLVHKYVSCMYTCTNNISRHEVQCFTLFQVPFQAAPISP